jgi:2-polyprenyl-3-methyl-5-hydroxy-6-metoxy-1,4-benzoquinol methylase
LEKAEDAEMNCPACQSHEGKTLERVLVSDLVDLWARAMQVDVSSYFGGVREIAFRRCVACDLRFFDPPCPGDAVFYERLQSIDWYYMDDKPEYDYAAGQVCDGSRLLEVGCGKGAFRAFLPAGLDYVGLEFNDAAVAQARSSGLTVLRESVEAHATLHPEAYDVVCSFQVLEHVPDTRQFVRACVGSLRPGGKLILAVPAEDSFLAFGVDVVTNLPPHHVTRWSDTALRNLAAREGLSILDLWHEPIAAIHRDFATRIFARRWFASRGVCSQGLISNRGRRTRVAERLLRRSDVVNHCGQSAARRHPHADWGHTVVLVVERPILVP